MTKTIQLNHKDWVDRIPEALWAYRITWRNTTGHTPYELVYGKQVLFNVPPSFRDAGAGKRTLGTCGDHPQISGKFLGDGATLGP